MEKIAHNDDDPNRSLPPRFHWLSLGVVLFALAGSILYGSRIARAGTLAEGDATYPSGPIVDSTVTHTVFLPLVFATYPCFPLDGVSITGSITGTAGVPQSFTAVATPAWAFQPVTYVWQATGQTPVTHQAGMEDEATFTWSSLGSQTVTVEAVNGCGGTVSDTVRLTVTTRDLVAFERRSEGSENHDLFLLYKDGSRLENLTNYPGADDGAPTWSPDGNSIAFASTRVGNGNHAIYKIDLVSRQVTQLTSGEYDDRWPTWSPKGDRIAFMRDIGQREIYVMDTDGKNQLRLTSWEGGDEFPAWSPDGQWIAFSSERFWVKRDLWLVRPDGSDLRIVLRTDPESEDDVKDEIYPTWSPDGRIYYTFKIVDDKGAKRELLYRVWPDGSGREKVFADNYNRYIATFAPDGECFAFYGFMGGPDKEIWKWCQGYSSPVNLTSNDAISDEFCAWSPAH